MNDEQREELINQILEEERLLFSKVESTISEYSKYLTCNQVIGVLQGLVFKLNEFNLR